MFARLALTADTPPHPVFEEDIQFFESIDSKVAPPPNAIVFLGSSTIDRWNLTKSFPGLPVVNRGLDGSRIADATYLWNRTVARYLPQAIVLYAGDNDLAEGNMTPDAVFANFRAFVAAVHAADPKTRVVFIAIKPSIERWELIDSIRQTNTQIRKFCESDPLTSYVDVEGAMLGGDGKPKKELFTDGLHLSETGYRLWASLVAPHLTKGDPVPVANIMDKDVVHGELGQKLHEHMSRLAEKDFSGALLVAKDGNVVLAHGYGMADRAAKTPFTSTTVFDIGSITKQFTGAAIAKLEMQGKLSADDKLSKFFPNVPHDKAQITLHHLLTHSAGLQGDFGGDYEVASRDWIVEQALGSKLLTPPGKRHRYSNSGFSLLAAIIEQVSGQSYEAFLREQLWLPAGMDHTGYRLPKWQPGEIAHGYREAKDWGTPLDKRWAEDGPYWKLRGNGGVLSTAWDMYRWHVALAGDKVLSSDAKERMFARTVKEGSFSKYWYNYGWSLHDTPRGTRVTEHNGGNGIFFADFVRYIDEDTVIIAASNRAEDARGDYMREITKRVFP